jgi:hypothetical protein
VTAADGGSPEGAIDRLLVLNEQRRSRLVAALASLRSEHQKTTRAHRRLASLLAAGRD